MANLAVSYQAEGMPVDRWVQRSADKAGMSVEDWRKAVLKKLEGSKDSELNKAAQFLKDRKWTDTKANPVGNDTVLKDLLDHEKYSADKPAVKKGGDGLPTQLKMWSNVGGDLTYDTAWQYQTSVSYVVRDENKKMTSQTYVDPETEPGIVKRGGAANAPLGSIMKVADPKNPNNPLQYARVIDAGNGDAMAEINVATAQNLGDLNPNPNATGSGIGPYDVSTVAANPWRQNIDTNEMQTADKLGKGNWMNQKQYSPDAKLGNENTQYAGWLAENKGAKYDDVSTNAALNKTMEKYKDDPTFKDYQKRVKEELAKRKKQIEDAQKKKQAAAGGDRVERGVAGVLGGKDLRQIVTVTAPTQSGDELAEGRWGTYAGIDRQPVSTLGSLTKQGQAVVTALDNVYVFGSPTSAPA